MIDSSVNLWPPKVGNIVYLAVDRYTEFYPDTTKTFASPRMIWAAIFIRLLVVQTGT